VRHAQADPSAAADGLGFRAEVGLWEGLERTLVHYRAEERAWQP
jgi:nucleoside-diphosphate-sugar epimerase